MPILIFSPVQIILRHPQFQEGCIFKLTLPVFVCVYKTVHIETTLLFLLLAAQCGKPKKNGILNFLKGLLQISLL